jgi:hypothetical protein
LASIDRTAYPRFKRVVSGRELTEAFTPTPDEITWARGKTQNDQHLLALVVRLKSYQRSPGLFSLWCDVVLGPRVAGSTTVLSGCSSVAPCLPSTKEQW